MKKIEEIENEIIEEFACFDEWMDKYNYIIELGKSLPIISDEYKTEAYLISGCQSNLWHMPNTKTDLSILKPIAMLLLPKKLLIF